MSYVTEILADNPRVYLRHDDTSGFPQDSSGNDRHCDTAYGAGTAKYAEMGAFAVGGITRSIYLDGAKSFSTPDHAQLDLGNTFSLELWVRLNRVGQFQDLFSKGGDGASNGAYNLRISDTNLINLVKDTIADDAVGSTVLSIDGKFHHVVATHTTGVSHLYLDGVEETLSVNVPRTFNDTANILMFGNDFNDSGGNFKGWLDELAVYATVLSQTRVTAHYLAGIGPQILRPSADVDVGDWVIAA